VLSFFKKSTPPDFFPISTDIHSHILPGIDDGSPDIDTSVELVKGLMDLGFRRSVATPHIISDMYRNTPETIRAARDILREELKRRSIDFQVDAAAEYLMDEIFFEKIEKGEALLCIKDKIILTEFGWGAMPENPKQMSFSIITSGYTPILAHPERYSYFQNNFKAYHFMQDLGFLLQVNLSSLTGYYGPGAMKAAKYIIKNNLCSFLGTDLHNTKHLQLLNDGRKTFSEILGDRNWNSEFNI
jgi:protein-tyrosine phosphatase